MPNKRNSEFYRLKDYIQKYRTPILTGIAGLLTGLTLSLRCTPTNQEDKPTFPYPSSSQIYKLDGINSGFPVLRTLMSDGTEEILNSSNAEGKTYTNVRDLEKKDVEGKRQYWADLKTDITSKIRESEIIRNN